MARQTSGPLRERHDSRGVASVIFPDDSAARKTYPVFSGLVEYFPAALAAVAHHSYVGNQKHNPGQPLHHDRAKSGDEADALLRHLIEGDYVGVAWRGLSLLQKHLEAQGAPIAPAARNARVPEPPQGVVTHKLAAEYLRDAAEADDPAPHDGRLNPPATATGD
jgi:hypothetical protein